MSEVSIWDLDGTIRPGSLSGDAVVFGIELGIFDPSRFRDPLNPAYDEVPYFTEALAQQSRHHFNQLTDKLTDEATEQAFGWSVERLKQYDHVLILSQSPDFLVRAFARGLNTVRHARGSYFHTRGLEFSGRAVTLDKSRAASRYIREKKIEKVTFAAGDTMVDVPVLLKAERAAVVNPSDELLVVANQNGWDVVRLNS